MHPIPRPELLDPERTLSQNRDVMVDTDDRGRARLLDDALHLTSTPAGSAGSTPTPP